MVAAAEYAQSDAAERSRPRRIAIYTGNYVSVVDGVSRTLNRLVAWLTERGDEVLVLAPDAKPRALEPAGRFHPVPAIPFWAQPEYGMAYGRGFRRALRAFEPDIVQVATPDLMGHFVLSWARSQRYRVVASFHSNLVAYLAYTPGLRPTEAMGWAIFRSFYGRCRQVYVPTESMAEELQAHGVVSDMRIWSRGVDHERFSPAWRSDALRRSWASQAGGGAEDVPVVLFTARLRAEKGLDRLAEIADRLRAIAPPHRFVVVGDGVARASLQTRLPYAVFTGHLDGEALAAAYASADVFLYPSHTDTFGNVTLEAMASGLAAVCARAPGSRSLVLDEQTGLLAETGDIEAFAQATTRLLLDPQTRARLASAARARSLQFSWEAAMRQISGYYDEVLRTP